jgi:hypothetical protein
MPVPKRKLHRRKEQRQKRREQIEAAPLHPDYFYRLTDSAKYFGYKATALADKIAAKEIPEPVSLSDSGRARGYFGRTIIAWQHEREAKSSSGKAA